MLAAYNVERDPTNPDAVIVRAVSILTGKDHRMAMPIGLDAFIKSKEAYYRGALIQNAFPTLDADCREFIKTGITPAEWEEAFGEED